MHLSFLFEATGRESVRQAAGQAGQGSCAYKALHVLPGKGRSVRVRLSISDIFCKRRGGGGQAKRGRLSVLKMNFPGGMIYHSAIAATVAHQDLGYWVLIKPKTKLLVEKEMID